MNLRPTFRHRIPIPLGIALSGALLTFTLWRALDVHERLQVKRELAVEAHKVRAQLLSEMQSRILALVRLGRGWEIKGQPDTITWDFDAGLLVDHYSGLQAIAWVDPSLRIRWIAPEN